tara:strand:+ start:84 stop:803 length:720 start_codon:yes stop_codon:yes gene_type:complete
MLICYHYIKKPISFKFFTSAAISILLLASLIGLARNNFKIEDGVLTTGFTAARPDSTKVSALTSTFKYGLIPLDYIYEKPPPKLQYGSSLLTLVTNVIPRDIWGSKLDTSSMAMNKIYIEDKGPGPYEYPAGILGLGVMNFGWVIGLLFGYLLTIIFLMYAEVLYKKKLLKFHSNTSFSFMLKVIMSIYFIQTVPALVPGEFTNVLHTLILTKVIPIFIFLIFYKLLSKKYKRMNLEKI